jgi:hypothetical protein
MPRRPRIHLDGVALHIVQRGHNGEPCFFAKEDYFTYRHWLAEALAEAQCALHAYVLMTNHPRSGSWTRPSGRLPSWLARRKRVLGLDPGKAAGPALQRGATTPGGSAGAQSGA